VATVGQPAWPRGARQRRRAATGAWRGQRDQAEEENGRDAELAEGNGRDAELAVRNGAMPEIMMGSN
jgi:hypothetical protein